MTGARVYPALLLAVTLAGCSGAERPTLAPPATPRTFELGWKERSAEPGFEFRVGRIVNAVLEGDTVLRRGSFARVLFGPFTRIGQRTREEPADILWVTDHVVRL